MRKKLFWGCFFFSFFLFSLKFVSPSMYWYCSIIFTSPFLAVVWWAWEGEGRGGVGIEGGERKYWWLFESFPGVIVPTVLHHEMLCTSTSTAVS